MIDPETLTTITLVGTIIIAAHVGYWALVKWKRHGYE